MDSSAITAVCTAIGLVVTAVVNYLTKASKTTVNDIGERLKKALASVADLDERLAAVQAAERECRAAQTRMQSHLERLENRESDIRDINKDLVHELARLAKSGMGTSRKEPE